MSLAAGSTVNPATSRSRSARLRIGASQVEAWAYVLPALGLFLLFELYPILANLWASVSHPHGGVSLSRYAEAAGDPVFWVAIRNSVIWVVACITLEIAIGFPLAVLIELAVPRGRAWFRTLLFLPMVVTPSVIALVFTTIYAPDYGLLYGLFQSLGIAGDFPAVLGEPVFATYAVIVVNVWQWCGFFVLMYCVGIAQLDAQVLDAAAIDGAVGLARARYVLWPMLRATHVSLIVLGTIQALQQFPLIYLMTQGGPANASQTLATYIFQTGFDENRMGFASTIAVVLFVLALMLVAIEYAIADGWLGRLRVGAR